MTENEIKAMQSGYELLNVFSSLWSWTSVEKLERRMEWYGYITSPKSKLNATATFTNRLIWKQTEHGRDYGLWMERKELDTHGMSPRCLSEYWDAGLSCVNPWLVDAALASANELGLMTDADYRRSRKFLVPLPDGDLAYGAVAGGKKDVVVKKMTDAERSAVLDGNQAVERNPYIYLCGEGEYAPFTVERLEAEMRRLGVERMPTDSNGVLKLLYGQRRYIESHGDELPVCRAVLESGFLLDNGDLDHRGDAGVIWDIRKYFRHIKLELLGDSMRNANLAHLEGSEMNAEMEKDVELYRRVKGMHKHLYSGGLEEHPARSVEGMLRRAGFVTAALDIHRAVEKNRCNGEQRRLDLMRRGIGVLPKTEFVSRDWDEVKVMVEKTAEKVMRDGIESFFAENPSAASEIAMLKVVDGCRDPVSHPARPLDEVATSLTSAVLELYTNADPHWSSAKERFIGAIPEKGLPGDIHSHARMLWDNLPERELDAVTKENMRHLSNIVTAMDKEMKDMNAKTGNAYALAVLARRAAPGFLGRLAEARYGAGCEEWRALDTETRIRKIATDIPGPEFLAAVKAEIVAKKSLPQWEAALKAINGVNREACKGHLAEIRRAGRRVDIRSR